MCHINKLYSLSEEEEEEEEEEEALGASYS